MFNFDNLTRWGTKRVRAIIAALANHALTINLPRLLDLFALSRPTRWRPSPFERFRKLALTLFGPCRSCPRIIPSTALNRFSGHNQSCMAKGAWAAIIERYAILFEPIYPILLTFMDIFKNILDHHKAKSVFTVFIPILLERGIAICTLAKFTLVFGPSAPKASGSSTYITCTIDNV